MRWLEVERSDWVFSPGRTAIFEVGGFQLAVNTADGMALSFQIAVGRWSWGWSLYRTEVGPYDS